MNKKSTKILLSILHICILVVCILTIYNNRHSGVTVAHVSFDTRTAVTPKETEPDSEEAKEPEAESVEEQEPEGDSEEVQEPETEAEPEAEAPAEVAEEPETEEAPENTALYSFRFIGKRSKLNIRSAPSMNAGIIAKVPVGGSGSVLELTDEKWVKAEYEGIVGYCSRDWIELQEITE